MKNFVKTFWAAFFAFFAANIVISIVGTVAMIIFFASMAVTGPEKVEVNENSILTISLQTKVADVENQSFQAGLGSFNVDKTVALFDIVNAIDDAAQDDDIAGVYIDVTPATGMSISALEEIRAALLRFKTSGKFIVSYGEVYPQTGYYLASVADSIFLNPKGGFTWKGMASNVMFMKGLLDKLDIEPQVVRHGEFKSAVEPYILKEMSRANRLQYTTLLETLWGSIVSDVAASRNIDSAQLVALADNLYVSNPDSALRVGLVTALKYRDEVDSVMVKLTDVDVEDDEEPEYISVTKYISAVKGTKKNRSKNHIAVVYAEGQIIDGKAEKGMIGSESLSKQLAKIRKDDDVKALVLRVNSPGGSALASEVIWRELELVRAEKPIIVSMGDYAASGGYYISAPADAILANRTTLTGSIGVFGLLMNGKKTLEDNMGLNFDVVKTNRSADMGAAFMGALGLRPLTKEEREVMQQSVEDVYTTFIQRVADGRNLSVERVNEIGGGRVWSGVSAKELGLIDGYGGLREAIALAADRAGIASDFKVVFPSEEEDPMQMILKSLTMNLRAMILGEDVVELQNKANQIKKNLNFEGVQALMPYTYEIQ